MLGYEEQEDVLLYFIRMMFQLGNELDQADALEYMEKYHRHELLIPLV